MRSQAISEELDNIDNPGRWREVGVQEYDELDLSNKQ